MELYNFLKAMVSEGEAPLQVGGAESDKGSTGTGNRFQARNIEISVLLDCNKLI